MTAYRSRREQGMYAPSGPPAPGPDDKYEVDDEPTPLADMTKAELIDLARSRGVSPAHEGMSKADLIAALGGQ